MRKPGHFTKAVSPGKSKSYARQTPRKPPMTYKAAGAKLKGSRLGKARKGY